MGLKHGRLIWAVNIDLKHPVDIVEVTRGREPFPERENQPSENGALSDTSIWGYGQQKECQEKDKEGVSRGGGRKPGARHRGNHIEYFSSALCPFGNVY